MASHTVIVPLDAPKFDDCVGPLILTVDFYAPCPACRVRSKIRPRCATCSGTDQVPESTTLRIVSPSGIQNGTWFRYSGVGPRDDEGNNGDLLLLFNRAQNDLEVIVSTTRVELERGAVIELPFRYNTPCFECRGTSAFLLANNFSVFTGTVTKEDAGLSRASLPKELVRKPQWCDSCSCTGTTVKTSVRAIRAKIPPNTLPTQRLCIESVKSDDGYVLGDLWVSLEVSPEQGAGDHIEKGKSKVKPDVVGRTTTRRETETKTKPETDLGGIVLAPDVKKKLLRAVAMHVAGDPAAPQGLLLAGPPGTGKTLLAKEIAKLIGGAFFPASLPDLKGAYIGQSGQLVRKLWNKANKADRAVLFIDECDAAFPARGAEEADDYTQEINSAFLAEWDGFASKHTTWVIGATNRPEVLDDAIMSRFGEKLTLSLPDAAARALILRKEFRTVLVDLPVDQNLIEATVGFSGRDLRNLASSVKQETYPNAPSADALHIVIERMRKRLSTGVDPNARWETLVLDSDLRRRLQGVCSMLKNAEALASQGIDVPKTLLLHGPPGTGKTQIARTLANESKLQFIGVTTSDIKAPYLGQSAQRVRQLFARARSQAPTILFIDEIDTVASARSSQDASSQEIVGELLQQLDGIKMDPARVFLVAATNNREQVDPGILSRFQDEVSIPLPTSAQRAQLLTVLLAKIPCNFDKPVVSSRVASALEGVSGRDLKNLVEAAELRAVTRSVSETARPQVVLEEADLNGELDRLRKASSTSVDPTASWDRLVLSETAKSGLKTVCQMLKAAENLEEQGVQIPRALLLWGPPGTGKTQIARTLANESGLQFLSVTTADLKARYLGESGQRIKQIFSRARANAPCILFLDEVDSIAPVRGGADSDTYGQEMASQLLQELDGTLQQESHVFVVAATNRPDQIDAGILSRFTERKEIPLPDADARERLLEAFLVNATCNFDKAALCRSISVSLEGVSGRDLKNLVAAAQRTAVARAIETDGAVKVTLRETDLTDAALATRKERTTRVDPTATWERLILDESTKDDLRSVCVMLKSAGELERSGITVPTSLLLEGPPGTGKTQIARTLANESGLTFIGVTTSDLKAGFLGQSGQRIKTLFSEARSKAPCIVFIDELDAVAGQRGSFDSLMTEMIGQLLQELDGVKQTTSHVFVVGATNRAGDIDGGILSRFSWRVHIGLPDVEQRTKLLDVFIGHANIGFERETVCREIAKGLDGASGRDLKNIVEVAERRAITRVLKEHGSHTIVLEATDLASAAASVYCVRS